MDLYPTAPIINYLPLNTSKKQSEPQTLVLLGTPFHDMTMSGTLDWIAHLIEQRLPSYIVTANLDFAAQASKDPELQRIIVEAELVLCDGMPLLWISQLNSHPLRERVAGSDLIPKLAERSAEEGWRIFLLGGDPASLEAAGQNLQRKHPGLIIAGSYSPPFAPLHELDTAAITARIKSAAPDILLVAFGCPKQEKWIYQHYRDLGVPCCIGVGATIDFLAGKVHRAPPWIARLGLEWVFRLVQEPGRLAGRYFQDVLFLFSQLWREKKGAMRSAIAATAGSTLHAIHARDVEVLHWSGPLIVGTIERLTTPSYNGPFIIDISGVTLLDSRGLGHLLKILRQAWKKGQLGCYASPSAKVRSILEMTRLHRVIPTADSIKSALKLLNREQFGHTPPPAVDLEKKALLLVMPQQVTSDTVVEFQDELFKEWQLQPSLQSLQLDFDGTLLLDSTGLGFIVRCRQIVSERPGARLKLLRVTANVLDAIRTARMEDLLGLTSEGKPR